MKVNWLVMLVGVLIAVPSLGFAQTKWVDDPVDPVLGPAEPGAWDGGARYPMAVIEIDGTYHLYFNGQPEGAPILEASEVGHATSTDGVNWELDPANPVLTRGSADEWDDRSLWGVAVIHDDAGFRMWYSGFGMDAVGDGAGYATSADGSTWTKDSGNPIIDVGPPGSFDEIGVVPGTVIVQDGVYRMWYMSAARTAQLGDFDWRIGYAESADGLSWSKHPAPVLEPDGTGWENWLAYAPSVIFDGSTYHMWYTGHSGVHVAIGYAVSGDGIEWTRYARNPVLDIPGSFGAQDANVLFNGDTGMFEVWYQDVDAESVRRASSNCCSTIFLSVIPAAAYAAGAEGSFYETDLDLSNSGGTDANYHFFWLPRGQNNGDPAESEYFTLAAGMSVRYSNVLAEVFDLEPDVFGALLIETSSTDVLASARIANVVQDKDAGTFGQAMPAIPLADFTEFRERQRILFGTETDAMRFNVGCQSASDTAARVSFDLVGTDGRLLGTESLVLMAWGNDQLNRVFGPYEPATGCVDFWTDTPGTAVYCYGSLLDNITNDPTTIAPQ